MEFHKKAWIVTGVAVLVIVAWSIVALHDSKVAEVRAKRAEASSSSTGGGGCPFGASAKPAATKAKPCCHKQESSASASASAPHASHASTDQATPVSQEDHEQVLALMLKKMKDEGVEIDEKALRKCPHYEEIKRIQKEEAKPAKKVAK